MRRFSNEYPQSIFSRNMKNIIFILSENFHFLMAKFSIYLNRRVFVKLGVDDSNAFRVPKNPQ